jgi:hypothetical protein
MSEQSDSVLDEAVRLMEGLRRRVVRGAVRGAVAGPRDAGDVWSRATREDHFDHIATGSAECRLCPICRTIAAARNSGPDVVDYVMDAGESLMAAAREAAAAYERSRRADRPPAARAAPRANGEAAERVWAEATSGAADASGGASGGAAGASGGAARGGSADGGGATGASGSSEPMDIG